MLRTHGNWYFPCSLAFQLSLNDSLFPFVHPGRLKLSESEKGLLFTKPRRCWWGFRKHFCWQNTSCCFDYILPEGELNAVQICTLLLLRDIESFAALRLDFCFTGNGWSIQGLLITCFLLARGWQPNSVKQFSIVARFWNPKSMHLRKCAGQAAIKPASSCRKWVSFTYSIYMCRDHALCEQDREASQNNRRVNSASKMSRTLSL